MSEQSAPLLTNTAVLPPPVGAMVLQRKCACGNHTIAEHECESCKKGKVTGGVLQRTATHPGEMDEAPPIVHEVLSSSGQPLDAASRSFFEQRFGRDFSRVRVHTDAKAAESAKSVNALAYTVGQNLVFRDGQFSPGSTSGRQLLAHELAHVVQQRGNVGSSGSGLRVDAAGSQAESRADAAAAAALRGSRPGSISAAPTMISRTPDPPSPGTVFNPRIDPATFFAPQPARPYTIRRVERIDDDTRRVFLSTGQRYRVTRQRRVDREVTEGRERPRLSARPGIDRENVWLDVEFCQGASEGSVRIGADIPDQVLRAMLANITSGGDIDAAIRNMRFTPFVQGQFQIRNWRITARAQATVGSGGDVTGAEGSGSVETDTAAGRVGVRARVGSQQVGSDPLGGVSATLNLEWTPGAPPRRIPDCQPRRVRVVERVSLRCDEETTTPARDIPRTREVPRTDERQVYIYFQYANARLDTQRSAAPLAELRTRLGEGYRVTGVHGFTSPEGPQGRGAGRFQGNDQLSRDRADAAVAQVQLACTDPSGNCFANASTTGQGELYTLERLGPDGQTREVEGPAQADEAAAQFRTAEAEAPHRTPDVERRLDRARTPQERADIVYPLLRRAAIIISRTRMVTESYTEHIPEGTATRELLPCPADIREAAFPPDDRSGGGPGPRR